jgi:hypothetical protein
MPGKTIATIQSYLDGGYTITAFHAAGSPNPCQHSSKLDLFALRDRLGPDYSIPDNHDAFVSMLRCEACQRKGGMSLIVSPPRK